MHALNVSSPAFTAGSPIPRKYTADGHNLSPPLTWSGAPAGTQQWVLVVDDPDAPRAEPWVHWLLYNIGAHVASLPEGVPPAERVADPAGGLQGRNSWNRTGYGGPQPPRGHGVHHYHFKLYALDVALKLKPGLEQDALLAAIQGHVIATSELIGTYQR